MGPAVLWGARVGLAALFGTSTSPWWQCWCHPHWCPGEALISPKHGTGPQKLSSCVPRTAVHLSCSLKNGQYLKWPRHTCKGDAPSKGRCWVPCKLRASGDFTGPACKTLTFKPNRSWPGEQHRVMLCRKSWKMIQMKWNFPKHTWHSVSGYFLLKAVSSSGSLIIASLCTQGLNLTYLNCVMYCCKTTWLTRWSKCAVPRVNQ